MFRLCGIAAALALIGVAISIDAMQPSAQPQPRGPYKVVDFGQAEAPGIERILNAQAAEGWKLHTVVAPYAILERK
jgi:hypothetical protein